MKVTTVSASVRFSRALGDGQHKTAELSAEATMGDGENWTDAQANLCQQLGEQLKNLWDVGNGAHNNAPCGTQNPVQPSNNTRVAQTSQISGEHYCQEHQAEFKRYSKGKQVWYAHKAPDGSWCREK